MNRFSFVLVCVNGILQYYPYPEVIDFLNFKINENQIEHLTLDYVNNYNKNKKKH